MITAQSIEQKKAEKFSGKRPRDRKRNQSPTQLANLVAPWTPATRPDVKSTGRPRDRAAELSRRVIEQNEEQIYKGLAAKAIGGDAYAFSVLSDRGYGKMKQGIIHTGDEDGGAVRTSIQVEFVKQPDGGK